MVSKAGCRAKGARFERLVKHRLEAEGWFVVRQAASAFPDLIAIKKNEACFIECKTNKYISSKEKSALKKLSYFGLPYIAYPIKEKGKSVVIISDLSYKEVIRLV